MLSLAADVNIGVARSGVTRTDDGIPYPSDADGMGVFGGATAGSVLITIHENRTTESPRFRRSPE